MRALHTAATGMKAQELNVQVISNNIANMRTTGYKRQRAEFQDLLYEHVRRVGTQTSDQGNILPAGIELGSGVKTVGTPRLMTQGALAQTGKEYDVAVRGEGFFKISLPDGRVAYTRDGSFELDATGRIVTAQGNAVNPSMTSRPTLRQSPSTRRARFRQRSPGPRRRQSSGSSSWRSSSTRPGSRASATISFSKPRHPAPPRPERRAARASAVFSRAASNRPMSRRSARSPI